MTSTVYWNDQNQTLSVPTEQDFYEWLQQLPATIAIQMSGHGYDKCKDLLSLRLHAAERNFAFTNQNMNAEM